MPNQTEQFLDELFSDKPERAAIQIWHRSSPPRTWLCDDLYTAVRLIGGGDEHDVYIACGLAPAASERSMRTRLKASEVVGIPGVWADIDVNGGPDDKDGAAPSREAALELASSLLEPSLLISSGYGIQAWWLWEDGPWMFPHRRDSDQAKRIVAGYQGALRAAARRLGWSLDATQDLSRVMRIPGTFNHKGKEPAPVELLEAGGRRYAIEEVGELGQGFLISQDERGEALESGEAITIQIRKDVPLDNRLMELLNEPEFRALWERKRSPGRQATDRDTSASGYEMAICNWLARAGLEPQAMADVIVHWRGKIEPGDPRKKIRRERIAQTIGKVIRTIEFDDHRDFVERTRGEAVDTLSRVAHGAEEPTEAKTLGAFNRIIGGPAIARLKQYSRDPQLARFVVELESGEEVVLGSAEAITSQTQFRRAYAVVTGHYPKSVSVKQWDEAVAGLLKAAVVVDETEDSRLGQMTAWIGEYVESAGSGDRDGACMSQGPFVEEGFVHLSLAHFIRWLRRVAGERVESADVAAQLRALKYDRKTLSYKRSNGSRSSRSYFVARTPQPSI